MRRTALTQRGGGRSYGTVAGLLLAPALLLPGTARALNQGPPPWLAGFPSSPATLSGCGPTAGNPVVADLGIAPGKKQIVFVTELGCVVVMKHDGTVYSPAFPRTIKAPGGASVGVLSSPAVGDLDGDGIPEIVVGYGSHGAFGAISGITAGGVVAYKRDGSILWQRSTNDWFVPAGAPHDGIPDPVEGTPAIGDVDGDGKAEVAFTSLDGNVYLVDGATGADKPSWPIFVRDTVFASPALFDLNADGRLEVIVGVDAHTEPAPFNTQAGGYLHVFFASGQPTITNNPYASVRTLPAPELPGFPRWVDQVITSSAAVGDIDRDGKPEIVVGTGRYYPGPVPAATHAIYAFKCDGSNVPNWPHAIRGQVTGSIALADVNGDGWVDVLASDEYLPGTASAEYWTYAIDGMTGAEFWRRRPYAWSSTNLSAGEPIVADITADAGVEIIASTNTDLCVWDKNGTQLSATSYPPAAGKLWLVTDSTLYGAAVGDIDGDGALDVVAISAAPDPKVYVWRTQLGVAPWPSVRYGPDRTGVYPSTPACNPPGMTAPSVSAVSPSSGTTSGGTPVTITGSNFQSLATFTFGASQATAVNVTGATQATALTPANSAGPVTVTATNSDGQSGSKASAFTYVAPTFALTAISPTGGSVGGGTIVTLTGTGFQAGAAVTLGGVAASVISVASTTIVASTGPHLPDVVDVVVTNPGGATQTIVRGFSYSPAATRASFFTVTPCRVFDTRNVTGADAGAPVMAAGEQRLFNVAGKCGVPADARSVTANVTVCCSSQRGVLHVVPGDGVAGSATGTAWAAGRVIAGGSMLTLATTGTGTVKVWNESTGSVHVILDVNGYYR